MRTVSNPVSCLYTLLGWQGGTIHQLAEALGVDSDALLYGQPSTTAGSDCSYMKGQYAYDTCSAEWVRDRLVGVYRGDTDFWLGYMHAFSVSA